MGSGRRDLCRCVLDGTSTPPAGQMAEASVAAAICRSYSLLRNSPLPSEEEGHWSIFYSHASGTRRGRQLLGPSLWIGHRISSVLSSHPQPKHWSLCYFLIVL
ncbi:unnamed protein product [Boreogadus saida]